MSSPKATKSVVSKLGLKPLNTQTLLYYYVPFQGVLSYTALSINVMNPSLVLRVFPRKDITNILLMNTLLGSGLYLYDRSHLRTLSQKERILYSAFGAVTFSLGSVLIWAILRSVIPKNIPLCTICGLGTSLAMIKIGSGYAKHLDTLVKET
ncbi:uncharacterized protein LOC123320915 [Coccinella septempunctata]|uniref:uncharacterized protein LOC123320915 n=1 Tax=Coccinella septempunctata TaxID=41139 RepID=UPI001D064E7C|nr:uncharacterized protein LOC123320915 [Coccinella septempunctata]